ncbi:single-stranded DNA-binding protein [Romboutsia maritimum]|uniref:Single-stranded DNA-binding protein n=1 Tax=Romboutsia maritimum TaxID=2020948 RepID=A0A371IT61_9FIRM|nr:single-stranded DNA-binding protein [Romboutsia maritimum]RDY23677.1 single-stranded DNA-binding protein [Romboutsia maritimum]
MNNVILVGRLTKDPELKYVGNSQSSVTEFTMAVDRRYKDKDGVKKTDFIKIEMWGKKAEICSKYVTKGKRIGVEGSLLVDNYQTINGENKIFTKVRAYNFNFLDSKYTSDTNKENKHYNATEVFEELEDEIPF